MKQVLNLSIIKRVCRIMILTLSILLVCISIFAGFLRVYSPGQVIPFVDSNDKPLPGSISEKIFINIGGVRQGMFFKSKDVNNPVLLYLHGGLPDYFLSQKYPTGLEDYFTMVWWEQRGSGLSYNAGIPAESMKLDQMISDTKELTNYLSKRFGQEKIYLMGHSGGTFIGIQVAAKWPELYHAYIGVAQMSDQLNSERLAYEFMVKKFQEKGNTKMVRKLEAAPVTMNSGTPDAYRALRDPAMHSLGVGTTHDMTSVIRGIFFPSLLCKEYTLQEKINMWRGKSSSGISILWEEMITTDLSSKVPELKLPVYFFEGIYDYTCSYSLAKTYFEKLNAPIKGFYTFMQSAHSPIFEEPEKVREIILHDVLKGTADLADKNKELTSH